MKEEKEAGGGRRGKISSERDDVTLFHVLSQMKGGLGGKGAWSGLLQEAEHTSSQKRFQEAIIVKKRIH